MKWEYLHEYVEARVESGKVVMDGGKHGSYLAAGKKVTTQLDDGVISAKLSDRGREGWELVNVEARWSWYMYENWDSRTVEWGVASYTLPSHLLGYYCVFRRVIG